MEADYLSQDWLLPEWHLLPQVAWAAFCLWGLPEVDLLASSHSTQCQHYFTLESLLPLGVLGLNAFSHPQTFQDKLCVSPSGSSPSSSVQVSGRTCQQSTQTFDSGGAMLDGGSLASHSSQHVGRYSSTVYHHKRSCHACSGRPGMQGSALSAFNPLAVQECVLHRQGFSWSVRWWQGQLKHYIKGLPAVLERIGMLVCSTGFTKQCHLCPYTSNFFCYICFRLDGTGIQLVYIILLFLIFWSLTGFMRLLIMLSSQN